jgi:hypothetical protein
MLAGNWLGMLIPLLAASLATRVQRLNEQEMIQSDAATWNIGTGSADPRQVTQTCSGRDCVIANNEVSAKGAHR